TVVSNLSAGAQGAITAVRGPIYADAALWWQVLWDSGTRGWSVDAVMQAASTGSDTTPPSVSITSPANGSTVSGKISVTASATDNVGVTKVEFYVDGTLLATDTSSPWTFSWDTSLAVAGNHTLSVKAYDAQGNIGNAAI